MKLVNPIGKKPVEKADMKAYACVCATTAVPYAPSASVHGYGTGCSYCGCSCGYGENNYSSNSSSALTRVTV